MQRLRVLYKSKQDQQYAAIIHHGGCLHAGDFVEYSSPRLLLWHRPSLQWGAKLSLLHALMRWFCVKISGLLGGHFTRCQIACI